MIQLKRISNNVKVKLPDEKLNQFAIPLNDVNTIAKIHPNKDQEGKCVEKTSKLDFR